MSLIPLFDSDGPVEGFTSATWRHGLSDEGFGEIEADPSVVTVEGVVTCGTPDGDEFQWVVEEVEEEFADADVARFSGRGRASAFERTIVLPENYPNQTERERSLSGPPLAVWRTLALEAQARGRLPWLTIGFTATEDSNGNPWTSTVDVQLEPGLDLFELLTSMTEVEGAEWFVTADGTLLVADQIGQDRSSEVVLFVGRDQLSRTRRKSFRDVRQTVFLEASTGISEQQTVSVDPDAGELWLESEDFADPATRGQVASKIAERQAVPLVEVEVAVSPDCGLYDRFNVGDLVSVDDGSAVSSVRVVAATVRQEVDVVVELTLVDQAALRLKELERAVEAKADVKLAASASVQRRHGLLRADRIETGSLRVDTDISSSDYVAGVAGWNISGDGEVEFDRGTFRGDLEAASGTFEGELVAATGSFSGEITAESGTIGGWTISQTSLSGDGKIEGGDIEGSTLDAVDGTFSGSLDAVDGTFSGSLDAVDGTFSGSLDAVDGTFEGTLDAVNGTFDTITSGTLEGVTLLAGDGRVRLTDARGIEIVTGDLESNRISFVPSLGSGNRQMSIFAVAGLATATISSSLDKIALVPAGVVEVSGRLEVEETTFLQDDLFMLNSERSPTDGTSRIVLDRSAPRILVNTFNVAAAVFGRRTNGNVVNFRRDGVSVGNIQVDTISTSYLTSSDERLKTDIEDLSGSLDRMLQLRPVMHGWLQDPDAPRRPSLLAQQANNVTPWAVSEGEVWEMDYSKLVPDLVAAIQELAKELRDGR